MMIDWLTAAGTKDIEKKYQLFSGVIKRVGEDFIWLAETLAALARVAGWEERFVRLLVCLSQCLIHGVTKKGLALSSIRIRGLGRTYINRLIAEGYDTPEAIADLSLVGLERLLPKHLAERLYRYYHKKYPVQGESTEWATSLVHDVGDSGYTAKAANQLKPDSESMSPAAASLAVPASTSEATLAAAPEPAMTTTTTTTIITTKTAPPASDISFPRHLADILQCKSLLFALRTRLADTKDLRELIADPPIIFMDERQQLFFYRGIPIKLQPACFRYLLLLTEKPKQIVARDEIYHRLWPGPMNYDGSNKPYDRQISDHKRRCIAQIMKGITGKIDLVPRELECLILTRPKVGYMLNVGQEAVLILPPRCLDMI